MFTKRRKQVKNLRGSNPEEKYNIHVHCESFKYFAFILTLETDFLKTLKMNNFTGSFKMFRRHSTNGI